MNTSTPDTRRSLTYEAWMALVDRLLSKRYGVTSDDLGDWRYYSAWDEGMSAQEAARRAYAFSGGKP